MKCTRKGNVAEGVQGTVEIRFVTGGKLFVNNAVWCRWQLRHSCAPFGSDDIDKTLVLAFKFLPR